MACLRSTCVEACIVLAYHASSVSLLVAFLIAAHKSNAPLNLRYGDYAQYWVAGTVHESFLCRDTKVPLLVP
ncbi:hypothetical protein PanWU01x14_253710 [Parasponia andersonii]|uniref:Uncharacterized protein n=1 Tax=Parasponia andersonii TaxID=3476 RepID=A0A2P5BBI7_PARAD|nr:hypothetical protein PanWU01x14_253710 [Parasponia andersonii]